MTQAHRTRISARASWLARAAVWLVAGVWMAGAYGGAAGSLVACGESAGCTRLRDDTYAEKSTWSACDPSDPLACIKVPGNPRDCTGVLACDFAINRHYQDEAARRVLTIAQDSLGCYLCAKPDCPAGDLAYCEPVSKHCIIASEVIEGGTVVTPTQEAGGLPIEADTTEGDASTPYDGGVE